MLDSKFTILSMSAAGSAAPLPPQDRDAVADVSAKPPYKPESGLSVLVKVIGFLFLLPGALILAVRYWSN